MVKVQPPYQSAKAKPRQAKNGLDTRSLQSSKLTDNHSVGHSCASQNPSLSLDTIAQPVLRSLADLKKRAKNRYFSTELARHLTALDSPLNKAYRRTLFDCGAVLIQEGQKVTSRYCNARWCNTCNRIRTAKLIEGYSKPLEAFLEPYFVTLTIPNVKAEGLKMAISDMLTCIRLIVQQRRRLTKVNGIRKLECTYNAEANTFHPHFHFIIDGKDNAEWMVQEWLKRNPTSESWCQDYRKADKGSLTELFKYTTKIVSKTDRGFQVFIKPLDTIFQAMHRVRTFQPFGSVKMVSEEIEDVQAHMYDIPFYESVVWTWAGSDWYSMLTGEALTGYEPSKRMNELTKQRFIT